MCKGELENIPVISARAIFEPMGIPEPYRWKVGEISVGRGSIRKVTCEVSHSLPLCFALSRDLRWMIMDVKGDARHEEIGRCFQEDSGRCFASGTLWTAFRCDLSFYCIFLHVV